MFVQKNNFVIKCEPADESFVESLNLAAAYDNLKTFFEFKRDLQIKVHLLYSLNEFSFFNNARFEKWMCGFTGNNNTIFVFSPSVIENLTDHKKEEVSKIIIHELVHIFYGYCGFANADIFREGLATYLASPNNCGIVELGNINLNVSGPEIYNYGANVINTLLANFGKAELFSFLREAAKSDNVHETFKNKFL
jgi:hypothetical protein